MKCCVPSCDITADNYAPTVLKNQELVTFHEFPTIPWLRKSWLVSIGMQECYLPQGAVVCSQHFEKENFSETRCGIIKLRRNSIPSLFRIPKSTSSNFEITSQSLKSIDRVGNLLTSNIVRHSFKPDHCDLCLIHNEEDYSIPKEENIIYNSEENIDVKSECSDGTLYDSEKSQKDYETEYLSDLEEDIDVKCEYYDEAMYDSTKSEENEIEYLNESADIHNAANNDIYDDGGVTNNYANYNDTRNTGTINTDVKSENYDEAMYGSKKNEEIYEIEDLNESSDIHNAANNDIYNDKCITNNSANYNDTSRNTGIISTDVKTENYDEAMYGSKKSEEIYVIEYLNESDDIHNDIYNNSVTINRRQAIYNDSDTKNTGSIDNCVLVVNTVHDSDIRDIIYPVSSKDQIDDDDHIINTDVKYNAEIAIDKDDVMSSDSYEEVEFLDSDVYHDTDTYVANNIDPYIVSIDHDMDKLLNKNNVDGGVLNKLACNNSDNRVTLNNFIFVKDTTTPIIQYKDFTLEKNNANQNLNRITHYTDHKSKIKKQTINKFVMQSNETVTSNNNRTVIKQNSTVLNEIIKRNSRTTKNNESKIIKEMTDNVKLSHNFSKDGKSKIKKSNKKRLPQVSASKISGRWSRRDRKPQTCVPRNKTEKCTKTGLPTFTKTMLTYEEQLAEMQKLKDAMQYKKSPFKCDMCFRGFWVLDSFVKHSNKHSDKFGPFECAICGMHEKTRICLTRHLSYHAVRYACQLCAFVTDAKLKARDHDSWHKGKTFKCQYCGVEFRKRSSWFSHIRLKHPSDSVCALCGFSFVSPAGVRQHLYLKHPLQDVENLSGPSCEECNIRFASETAYQQHMAVSPKHAISGKPKRNEPSLSKKYWPSCYKSTSRYPSDKILCELCGKAFQSAAMLRQHMGVHTGKKQFECEICHKRFAYKISHKAHMTTHSDDRPRYRCGVCHKEFSSVCNRRKHMLSHQDTRPVYKCETCNKTFTSVFGLDQHVSHVHRNKPWPKRNRRDRLQANTRRP